MRAGVRVQAARNRNRKPSKQGCRKARQGAGSDKSTAETLMMLQENAVALDLERMRWSSERSKRMETRRTKTLVLWGRETKAAGVDGRCLSVL